MNALVLTSEGLHLESNWPAPTPGPDEALIRVGLAGICSTDIEMTRGYKGGFVGVLGHEFVGKVIAAAAAPDWIGRRVVGEINVGCGICNMCRRGLSKHCYNRATVGIKARNGAFADYVTLPLANLHEVPQNVTDEQAVFAEPLAAAFQVLEQVQFTAASRVFVLGAGRLGMLCAMVLAAVGCDLTVIGRHADKLQLLATMGILNTILADTQAHSDLVHAQADVVVDATGSVDGFRSALDLVRPGGIVVMKSTYAGGQCELDTNRIVVDEISLVGSRCGPFPQALAALASGAIVVDALIDARFPLQQGVDAIEFAQRSGVLKVLLVPDAELTGAR